MAALERQGVSSSLSPAPDQETLAELRRQVASLQALVQQQGQQLASVAEAVLRPADQSVANAAESNLSSFDSLTDELHDRVSEQVWNAFCSTPFFQHPIPPLPSFLSLS